MFESMMELSESGLRPDGAVDRPELVHVGQRDYDMTPEQRSELEEFVYAHTPCRHKFTDMRGKRGIVYFDQRGRAADCLIGEMASTELMRQARLHGWRGAGMDRGGVADTAHGTLAMQDNARAGAGYPVPRTEAVDVPASEVPDASEDDPDYMPLVRRMLKVIREQSAPRSKVTASRKKDGNILIAVDAHTPLVVDTDGYVYETTFGHTVPRRRIGHIRDLLETGFTFRLNALNYYGLPETMEPQRGISEEVIQAVPEGSLREAARALCERFGGYRFDAFRAWAIGVDRHTLSQLQSSGTLERAGDQFRLVPLRQESVDIERVSDEGWGVLAEQQRSEPVSTSDYKRVVDAAMAFWHSLSLLEHGLGVTSTWSAMVDGAGGDQADKLDRAVTAFSKHSRTWRSGVTLFKEKKGRVDVGRLQKDVKASLSKAKKLLARLDKVSDQVKKDDAEEWADGQDRVKSAREGYRQFVRRGQALLDALQSI